MRQAYYIKVMFNSIKKWFGYSGKPETRAANWGLLRGFDPHIPLPELPVTPQTALKCPAVLCAVQVLSSDLASLPICTFIKDDEGGKEKADTFWAYQLLHDKPNPYIGAKQFWKTFWSNLFTHGHAYAYIVRLNDGTAYLQLMHPDRIRIKVTPESYVYVVDGQEGNTIFPQDMIHIRWYSEDGIDSTSPIEQGKEIISLALALDRYGVAFFRNGARLSGVLKHPAGLSTEGYENLQRTWQVKYGGIDNAWKTPVLEEGMEYQPLSANQDEAQYNETRGAIIISLAQLFNIPVYKLKDLGRMTWNNIASESLSYVRDSLRPWTLLLEDELNKLLPEGYFAEHNFAELLRADPATRASVYQIGLQNGYYQINEVRGWENLDELPEDELPEAAPEDEVTPEDTNEDQGAEQDEAATDTPQPEEDTEQEIQTLPESTLNGAQISSAVQICQLVAAGELPRDAGIGQLQVLLNLSLEQAEQCMGSVGKGFEPATTEAPPEDEAPEDTNKDDENA
jgi:HK97 family phage portal protein